MRSDHSPIIVSLKPKEIKGQKVFRFELMWTNKPESIEIIYHNQASNEDGDFEDLFCQNLEDCKRALTKWSKVYFLNNRRKVDSILHEL